MILKNVFLQFMAFLTITAHSQDFTYQYSVKFVCGPSNGRIISAGEYRTAINILNPNGDSIVAQSIISVALPGTPGMVSTSRRFTLGQNQSLEIDCDSIIARTRQHGNFRKGFVILTSTERLEVVAVYTASGADRRVESIHTERVTGLKICPDLVVASIAPRFESRDTTVRIRIKNIGAATTGMVTQAMVTDPSTIDPSTGERYKQVVNIPVLDPGSSTIVTVVFPYNIFNPDAFIRVDADYTDQVAECMEDNNAREFHSP